MSSQPINVDGQNGKSRSRRSSFFDMGGPNSISNFASSYKRAQKYLGSTFLEDLSPNTSPPANAIDDALDTPLLTAQGYNNIKTYKFASVDEESALLDEGPTSPRRSTVSAHHFGNSTGSQTFFNSVNTLMGVGMLSLPFGMKLAGWFSGSIILASCSFLTCVTAIILGRIIQKNPHLRTYGDIAHAYGGPKFAYLVTILFTVDLLGASLSLILLFSDSFSILFPHISSIVLRGLIVLSAFALSFVPLSILSILSLSGIFSVFSIIVVVFISGLSTNISPGSLLNTAPTHFYPLSTRALFLSFGLFMAPWGGHPVFPELYHDMRHTSKYSKCCKSSFTTTFSFDYMIAFIGFLMFGIACEDSVVKNLMANTNYPRWVNPLICAFMGLVPISKLPLVTKPIITVFETYLGVSNKVKVFSIRQVLSRLCFFLGLFLLSLIFTSFGQLVSLLGSLICFTICLTLPLLFYLHFFKDISVYRQVLIKIGILIGIGGALLGTYASLTIDSILKHN